MKNRLYPNWNQLNEMHNPLTPGERALITFLDDTLPYDNNFSLQNKLSDYKGWLIFAQPFLNGTRPDIIIFHPFVGIVIYEVKDWNLNNYEWKIDEYGGNSLYVNDGKGSYQIKNPMKQVSYYKDIIIGQLVPAIGEQVDKNKKKYGVIKTGLYFHNEKTENVRKFFQSDTDDFRKKSFPIFGKDFLNESNLGEIVPSVSYNDSPFWERSWNDELMFWLNPPFHSIEQGTPLKLKYNQLKIAEPAIGHHRVRGVAGSGKTQAMAYRAGKLASMNLNVLVITFNITLWHYIKDMIARAPFNFDWKQIKFCHFHGFCKDILNQFEVDWPKDHGHNKEEFFRVVVTNAVIKALKNGQYSKYDAILIDEGQDYNFEWYQLLNNFFLTNRDEVLIVCDKKQNIYKRTLDWLDKRINRIGLEKFINPFIDLTVMYRMPNRVALMSNKFSEMFNLDQELKVSKIETNSNMFEHIVWINIQEMEWLEFVYNAFLRLKNEGKHPSDIVILLPNHKQGMECVKFFEDKKINVNHVFEQNNDAKFHTHKRAFWMGDSRLKMSTIHSFKGWELLNIILLISVDSKNYDEDLDALVYTAITRTKENLIILNTNRRYDIFGNEYPNKWNEQVENDFKS